MEVYVDDMLVKSREAKTHLATFKRGSILNPTKCLFGVSYRKFLGFMVSQ